MEINIQVPSLSQLDSLLNDEDAQKAFRQGRYDAAEAQEDMGITIPFTFGNIYHGPALESNCYLIGYILGQWERISDSTKMVLIHGEWNAFRIGLGIPIDLTKQV